MDHFSLTAQGEAMAQLGLEPRLANLLLEGVQQGHQALACHACALLSEGDPFANQSSDFDSRLQWLKGDISMPTRRPKSVYQTSFKQWQQRCKTLPSGSGPLASNNQSKSQEEALAALLAYAFADRLGKRLGEQTKKVRYKLSNGRIAVLEKHDVNAQANYLVVLDLGGHHGQGEDRIFLAQPIDIDLLQAGSPALFQHKNHVEWSKKDNRLVYEEQLWLGKLCFHSKQASKLRKLTFLSSCAYTFVEKASTPYLGTKTADTLKPGWPLLTNRMRALSPANNKTGQICPMKRC